MTYIQTYQVVSVIPDSLSFLEKLAQNLWWCWQYDAVELFRRIDPKSWEGYNRNPIVLLNNVSQERLKELSLDESFLANLKNLENRYYKIIECPEETVNSDYREEDVIAYLSMEFGIHESIPLFAGGLGILAGDHLKSASDHNLPLVGIGLMYTHGYFRQFLNNEGWQQERYPVTEITSIPVKKILDSNGNDLKVTIQGASDDIHFVIWELKVGRIHLFLLDTDIMENTLEIRNFTSRLYEGDSHVRLAQEILLGIGGMRALKAMGIFPKIYHMNEGHCAFAGIERISQVMEKYQIDFETALELVPRGAIFTTHTPVAAGHDEFSADMVRPYFQRYSEAMNVHVDKIMALGQENINDRNCHISMFVLALRTALFCNGVSELHGKIARKMWCYVWPDIPEDETPITHVTNGVHVCSYVSNELSNLFERYISPKWNVRPWDKKVTGRIDEIFDGELWRAHETSRYKLVRMCRRKLIEQYSKRNAPSHVMREVENALSQDVFTICFARRFATYKRATLLLKDPERLEKMITDHKRPVQFIFAGKAHPKDDEGKALIRDLLNFAQRPKVQKHFVFIEDYDINIARYMVQGGDIWLNNPRRPLEACGTSGIKAALNGVLNVSILDGWWCEGYSASNGWKIGDGEEYEDRNYQDTIESQAIFNLLEDEVIPCFYDRKDKHYPEKWINMMKSSMKMAMERFSSHRMVKDYSTKFYQNLVRITDELLDNNLARAKQLKDDRQRINYFWDGILLEPPILHDKGPFRVNDTIKMTAIVYLGKLNPEDVDIELNYGTLKSPDELLTSQKILMNVLDEIGLGLYQYACEFVCDSSGRFGFSTRITPKGDKLLKYQPGLIFWAAAPHEGV